MTELPLIKNDPEKKLQKVLNDFLQVLKERCGNNLKSVVLYGGAAKENYIFGNSNTNILFVFESVDLHVLDSIAVTFQKAMGDFRLSPFTLTVSEITHAKDVFAVKLFDIQQYNVLLYGEDYFAPLKFDYAHLRFIAEQELRNLLSRMKFFYIRNFDLPSALLATAKKGITTLLINANVLLFLSKGTYYKSRREIIENLKSHEYLDASILNELLATKKADSGTGAEKTKLNYDQLMVQCKQLIKAFQLLEKK